jgi:prenyltransferase beta subunit
MSEISKNPSLKSYSARLSRRLLDTQDPTGGWAEHPGGRLSAFNTAEAVLALSAAGVAPGDAAIQKAKAFLLGSKTQPDDPDSGAWARVDSGNRPVADILRTAMVISALISAGTGVDEPKVRVAIDWLVKRQNHNNDDLGWGYQRNKASEVLPTCFALLCLIGASAEAERNRWKDHIQKGLRTLCAKFRKPNGSFDDGRLAAAHTIYACLTLQAARRVGFAINASDEREAIKWLLRSQDDALSPIEETIPIDPTGAADYPFMFSMYSLLLRALANSENARDRETMLWIDVQRSMSRNFDEETGGFYGQRVFSWSTANGLYSIERSKEYLLPIPKRPVEDTSALTVGHLILVVTLVLVGAVVYLSAEGKFAVLQASIFGFLVLACLLAYGKIGEKSFKQLASPLLSTAKQPPADSSTTNA